MREAMVLLDEVDLKANLELALYRQIKATDPADPTAREYLYLQLQNLELTFDMMRQVGGQSRTERTGESIELVS